MFNAFQYKNNTVIIYICYSWFNIYFSLLAQES